MTSRALNKLAGMVRRIERGETTGRNFESAQSTARMNFELALRDVVAYEDELGVDAAARLSDRLTDVRQRATSVGLLSHRDVLEIEGMVID